MAIRELCYSPHCTTVIPLIAEPRHVMLIKVCEGPSVMAFVLVSERWPAAGRSSAYKKLSHLRPGDSACYWELRLDAGGVMQPIPTESLLVRGNRVKY